MGLIETAGTWNIGVSLQGEGSTPPLLLDQAGFLLPGLFTLAPGPAILLTFS